MSSPPYRSPAASPPYPPHASLPNPKKRPSINTLGPSLKRQKRSSIHSTASSAHPLRQTSFPPEESAITDSGPRSPSVESDFTAVTGGKSAITAGAAKKGRGRGKKSKKQAEGSVKSGGKEKTVDGTRAESEEAEEEEDEDEGLGLEVEDGKAVDAVADKEKISVLVGAFTQDQFDRYEQFRASKLNKPTVRRITNQTVSQSVPQSVITTVNGYTKLFVGTLIEKAREVQAQWAALETPPTTPPKNVVDESGSSALADLTRAAQDGEGKPAQVSEHKSLGPLLPDHLREALRRYKGDGEGGGTGMAGVSVGLGLQGTGSARLGGRRLFR